MAKISVLDALCNAHNQGGTDNVIKKINTIGLDKCLQESVDYNDEILMDILRCAAKIESLQTLLKFEWAYNKIANPQNEDLVKIVKQEGLVYTFCYKITPSAYFHHRNPIGKVVRKLKNELDEMDDLMEEAQP